MPDFTKTHEVLTSELAGSPQELAEIQNTIDQLKRLKSEREIVVELFKLIGTAASLHDVMSQMTSLMRNWSGCEAVGIRLREGEDYPYFETRGFPERFVLLERYLCAHDDRGELVRDERGNPVLECMCGNIIQGRFDPKLPFFTEYGSFWTNSTTKLLASTSEADRQARTRNRCNGEGYESVALVPLRHSGEILGLLQFNDLQPDRFDEARIRLIERLAENVAFYIEHFHAVEELRARESALRLSEEKFRTLYESMAEGVALHELVRDVSGRATDYRILDVNPSFAIHTGISCAQAVGALASQLYESMPPAYLDIYAAVADGGKPTHFETYFPPLDRHFAISVSSPGAGRFVTVFQDVSERKRAELILREEKASLRALVDTVGEGIIFQDVSGELLLVNDFAASLFGVTSEEVMRQSALDREWNTIHEDGTPWPPHDHPSMYTLRTGEPCHDVTMGIQAAGGSTRWIKVNTRPLFDEMTGKTRAAIISFSDITERKRIEEDLRERELFLIETQRIGRIGGWKANLDADSLYWSDEVNRIVEMPADYKPGLREGLKFYAPEYRPQIKDMLRRVLRDGSTDDLECEITTGTGRKKWANLRAVGRVETDGEAFVIGTLQDIDERKKNEIELIAARQKADIANMTKSEFLANMSHEIRTPLNGVMGMLQLMQGSDLDAEQREYVRIGMNSSRRLTQLLNDILDLARIESGKMSLSQAPYAVEDLCRSTLEAFAHSAHERGIQLALVISPSLPPILTGDEVRLRQILFNLVGNALKFTHEGRVTISMAPEDAREDGPGWIAITVRDTGIGIPQERLTDIFAPFTQVENSYVRSYQGAGLGLAIVKRLVDLMDGGISIASTVGEGTTVTVRLPLSLPEPSAQPATPPVSTCHVRPRPSIRILLVEDDPANQFAIMQMLTKVGSAPALATNGLEAIEHLARGDYDLVLMDINMPEMDGVEATERIRRGEAGQAKRDIPIIAMTAYAMAGDKEKFLADEMDDYIAKPVDMKELLGVIEKTLEKRRSF